MEQEDKSELVWQHALCVPRAADRHHLPSPRSGHSLSVVGSNLVYLFGGLTSDGPTNDLFVLRLRATNHDWSRVEQPAEGLQPCARWRHSSCKISATEFLVFGGHVSSHHRFNDVWVFNAVTMRWTQPVFSSARIVNGSHTDGGDWEGLPSPRSAHAATAANGTVYIFGGHGGFDFSLSHLGDIHALDTESWKWKCLRPSGKGPSARSGHKACAVNGSIYIWGGGDSERTFSDLHILDLSSENYTWTNFDQSSLAHPVRFHSCTVANRYVCTFGGVKGDFRTNQQDTYSDSLEMLDTKDGKLQWATKRIVNNGLGPKPRSDADMVYFSNNSNIILFGGWSGNQWFGDLFTLNLSPVIQKIRN